MAIPLVEFTKALMQLGVEIHDRGETFALRHDKKAVPLDKVDPVPIKQVRHIIGYLGLNRGFLSVVFPDLFGKPSTPEDPDDDEAPGFAKMP